MHITPEFAGLIAQVYPALLIAILLEGRLPVAEHRHRWVLMAVHVTKLAAILGGTLSTFLCLVAVSTKQELVLLDWLVSLSALAMFVSLSVINGQLTARENADVVSLFRRNQKVDRPEAGQAETEPVSG